MGNYITSMESSYQLQPHKGAYWSQQFASHEVSEVTQASLQHVIPKQPV